jgi:hypothetical protein
MTHMLIIGYVAELKNTFHSTGNPINDDDTTLQKLCVKFETILRHDQKGKTRPYINKLELVNKSVFFIVDQNCLLLHTQQFNH